MKLISLEAWVRETYGDAVTIGTARKWAKSGKIRPQPEKHGRAYFCHPDARYTDRPARLVDRLRAEAALPG